MNNSVFKVVLLTAGLILFAAALYVYSPNQNKYTRVTVVGDSQSKAAPDSAVVTFSVITKNSQAVAAQQENARKSEAVKKAVQEINAKAEIKTSDYSLQPEQDYSSVRMSKIIGYEAKNSVTVTVNDLSQTGALIDAATAAGANSVEGISFVLRDNSPARGDALALATRQAMIKAESIAQSLNGKIIRVVETHEAGVEPPHPQMPEDYSQAAGSMNSSPLKRAYNTPVEAGSLDIRSQIVLTVEIEVRK